MDDRLQGLQQRSAASQRLAQLPGPPSWPLVGHLFKFDEARLHLQLEDWSRAYGALYRLRFLRTDVVVLSQTDLLAEAFRARPGTWRRFGSIETLAKEAGVHGLFSAEGDDWARQRRLVLRAFDPGHLRRFLPRLETVIDRLKGRWRNAARSAELLDVRSELMRYSVDAVTGLAFGIDINTIEDRQDDLNSRLEEVLPVINARLHAVFPHWRYVRLPADRRFDRNLARIHGMLRDLIAGAREELENAPDLRANPRNLLQALLVAQDDDLESAPTRVSGGALTDDEVIGNLFTVLLAGQDTTASTLAWTLYLIAQHPVAWNRLVEEADQSGRQACDRNAGALPELPFAQACIAEAMRLHPVAPLHYFEACKDTSVGNVIVPRGTYLFCLTRLGAVDPQEVDEADKYQPERWLAAEHAGRLKKLSMPFGAGPRLCPGRGLAMLEMRLLLSMLAREFELARVDTAHGQPPREVMGFTMHPEPLRMRLEERRIHS